MVVITVLASVMLSSCAGGSVNTSGGSLLLDPSQFGPALSAIGTPNGVSLNWSASLSSAVGYNLYRGMQSGGPYFRLNWSIITVTNYIDTAVQSGQTYYYVATATNSSNEESDYSNEVAAPIP
jgi:hypothetical protein